jgi:transposase
MSGPGGEEQRFVVVAEARRRWTRPEKEAIVAELAGGASVSWVARKHNVASSLLFRWRRQFAAKRAPVCAAPAFVPVALPVPVRGSVAASPPRCAGNGSMIEIELVGGRRLRVDASVNVKALRRVIEALEQR